MARPERRGRLLWGLGAVLAVWAIWMVVATMVSRNPEIVSDQDAVVQPSTVPPPGGVSPDTVPLSSSGDPSGRGQSAVQGDGTPVNGSTQAPGSASDR